MSASDAILRSLILTTVTDRASEHGGTLTRADLTHLPLPDGTQVRVIDRSRGIWNPSFMDATLSVVSNPQGPYEDRHVAGGLYHYSYRAGSDEGDNRKLRQAYKLGLPIILLQTLKPGLFVTHAPVYVVDDLRDRREFLLALDESVRFLPRDLPEDAPQRRYAERVVRQRLHQAEFRGLVIRAYNTRCTVCTLAHGRLLDAAHIVGDADDEGAPVVTNGLSLCKIHHAAYDADLMGISPDFGVRINAEVLAERDGPMLKHGLQEMEGRQLLLPDRRTSWPDRDRLAERFKKFLAAS